MLSLQSRIRDPRLNHDGRYVQHWAIRLGVLDLYEKAVAQAGS